MKYLVILVLIACSTFVKAQQTDEPSIKTTINNLFNGMRQSDTTLLQSAFAPEAIMQTITKTRDGKTLVRKESLKDFVNSVGKPHPQPYDERIVFVKILIDDTLASVWTDYKFYVGNQFSHCGVNSFQLVKFKEGWKIVHIIDTRRKDQCN